MDDRHIAYNEQKLICKKIGIIEKIEYLFLTIIIIIIIIIFLPVFQCHQSEEN